MTLTVVGWDAPEAPEGVFRLGGIRDSATMARLYQETDLFVLPARCDPSPLVLVEAMSFGLPCVASRVDGIAELVEDQVTGILVPPESPEATATAIELLLTDEELFQKQSLASFDRVVSKYTWEQVARRMMNVVDDL